MRHIFIIGAGKIGTLIAVLLAKSNDFEITLADINEHPIHSITSSAPEIHFAHLDAQDSPAITAFLKKNHIDAIVSSLPYYHNAAIARIAKELNLDYFDLTEDTESANITTELSRHVTSAFVPQCGLAPGFISIITHHLMQSFSSLETVKMRVGALPVNSSNALRYALTWSTDGLINEYGNSCHALENGELIRLSPLDDLEDIEIDGLIYEAFNTSGGIGTLAETYRGRVKSLNYKTIRYPGHCEKIRLLMNDLNLNQDRATLKRILENVIPRTQQDIVLVYASVTGHRDGQLIEKNYVKKFYSAELHGLQWSAIQLTTATSLCTVLDMVTSDRGKFRGLVRQEQFSFEEFSHNRFGHYFA
jgi:saccharopine dehydrogenase-like NADP-dependent oxidoreductase